MPLIEQARHMISNQIELLAYTSIVIPQLAQDYPLMLITKGDLVRSGTQTGPFWAAKPIFRRSRSSVKNLRRSIRNYCIVTTCAGRFVMVGNSLRSDILPVLQIGASAVYIPFPLTWLHEKAETPPQDQAGFYQLEHMGLLPELLHDLEQPDNLRSANRFARFAIPPEW